MNARLYTDSRKHHKKSYQPTRAEHWAKELAWFRGPWPVPAGPLAEQPGVPLAGRLFQLPGWAAEAELFSPLFLVAPGPSLVSESPPALERVSVPAQQVRAQVPVLARPEPVLAQTLPELLALVPEPIAPQAPVSLPRPQELSQQAQPPLSGLRPGQLPREAAGFQLPLRWPSCWSLIA